MCIGGGTMGVIPTPEQIKFKQISSMLRKQPDFHYLSEGGISTS